MTFASKLTVTHIDQPVWLDRAAQQVWFCITGDPVNEDEINELLARVEDPESHVIALDVRRQRGAYVVLEREPSLEVGQEVSVPRLPPLDIQGLWHAYKAGHRAKNEGRDTDECWMAWWSFSERHHVPAPHRSAQRKSFYAGYRGHRFPFSSVAPVAGSSD